MTSRPAGSAGAGPEPADAADPAESVDPADGAEGAEAADGTDGTDRADGGTVAGVLLAAGEGRRLGRAKAVVTLDGVPLAERGVDLLRAGGCAPVVVVTGAAAVEVPGAIAVHNPHWRSGMGSSVRIGLAAVPPRCPAAVVALVDQPLITPAAVARLIDAHRRGARVAVATYGGRPRNPVLIAREYFDAVAARAVGDVGARAFLRAHPRLVTPVGCDGIADPADIDTPEDLERLAGRVEVRPSWRRARRRGR